MDHSFISETPEPPNPAMAATAFQPGIRSVGPAEEFAIHVIACGHCKSFPRDLCHKGRALLHAVELDGDAAETMRQLEPISLAMADGRMSPVEVFAIHVVGCPDCKHPPRNLCAEGILLFREMIQGPGLPALLMA